MDSSVIAMIITVFLGGGIFTAVLGIVQSGRKDDNEKWQKRYDTDTTRIENQGSAELTRLRDDLKSSKEENEALDDRLDKERSERERWYQAWVKESGDHLTTKTVMQNSINDLQEQVRKLEQMSQQQGETIAKLNDMVSQLTVDSQVIGGTS